MEKITVSEVRSILYEVLKEFPDYREDMARKNDEQLLETDLYRDYELDSLDYEEMLYAVYTLHGIDVSAADMENSSFYKETTVRNFIEMCNKCVE